MFGTSYRYYGARTSSISILAADADPEIDTMVGISTPVDVPDAGSSAMMLGLELAGVAGLRRKLL